MKTDQLTVVLGGGGVWGAAWITGIAKSLADAGVALSDADGFIGTSAGSVVSAQLASGLGIDDLFNRHVAPISQTRALAPDMKGLASLGSLLQEPGPDPVARARAIGALALKADTISFADRRAMIVERLGLVADSWPNKRLVITAVDAETAELVEFNAASGVSLIDAVCASCAVPVIWPVTPINGRNYIDGGVWLTPENAQLATGRQRVLIIAPIGNSAPTGPLLQGDIAMLEGQGAKVALIEPDAAALEARGPNMLDPASAKPGAEAGYAQARDSLAAVMAVLAS